ncbi:MAG: recombinase family protein [Oscillospiraceae bacterium]|nr:recombinase family protein [Oscillospiraceae bacterium]
MKTAAAYLRVSTEEQDEYSLDSQLKLIRAYAAAHDMIVPNEYVFQDETSGRSAKKRKDFQRMIGWAKEKDRPFETVLVWKFSRFARNQEESIVYKAMLRRCGVEVVSISEPLAEGPFGSLIERILEWMDEFYSIRLSGEVKRGMAEKVSRGEIVTPPAFGYDVDKKAKRYVPNGDAATVRKIYADYLSGVGMATIARELGRIGVRTSRGNLPDNRFVKYILQNPVYIGKLRWSKGGHVNYSRGNELPENGYLVDGRHEPLIDAASWEAVQDKLSRSERGRRKYQRDGQPVEWMLKGLVRCSSCGSTLVRLSTDCPSMQCHKYAHGQCRVSHSLSIARADRQVIAALEYACDNLAFPIAPHTVPRPAEGPDYGRQIAQERVKLRRVMEAYETEVYTLEDFTRRRREILARIAELEQLQIDAEVDARSKTLEPVAFREKVLDVLQLVKDPQQTEAAKNAALRSILSYIVYEKAENRLALYFFT